MHLRKSISFISLAEKILVPFSFVALVFIYVPIVTSHKLVGWDLTPHYHILDITADLLKMGRLSGYDTGWFGGYPLFKLYGIGPYIAALMCWIVTNGIVGEYTSFHIFLGWLPLILFYSVYKFCRLFFGRVAALYSIPLFFCYYFAPPDYFSLGFSAHSQIRMGLFGGILGICILINLINQIELGARKFTLVRVLTVSFLTIVLCHTHILTSLFAAGIVGFLFLFKKYRYFLLICSPLVLLCLYPLLLEILNYIPYQSSISIGLHSATSDPFFALMPALRSLYAGAVWKEDFYAQLNRIIALFWGYFIFVGFFEVRYRTRKFNRFMLLFLLGFILIPRNILPNLINLPIHYYRFMPVVLLLAIGMAGYSMSRWSLNNHGGILVKIIKLNLTCLVLLISFRNAIFFDWNAPSIFPKFGLDQNNGKNFNIDRTGYQAATDIDDLLNFLVSNKSKGRIIAESSEAILGQFGSPHVMLAELPSTGREILPGLLVESSIIGPLLVRCLRVGSHQLSWGGYPSGYSDEVLDLTESKILDRFRKMGIRFIVSSSDEYRKNLRKNIGLEIVEEVKFGIFSVFDLGSAEEIIRQHTKAPWLYFSNANSEFKRISEFRKFSLLWWSRDVLEGIPLITDPKLTQFSKDCEDMSGIIINFNNQSSYDYSLMNKIINCGKPIVVLGRKLNFNLTGDISNAELDPLSPESLATFDNLIMSKSSNVSHNTKGAVEAGIDGIHINSSHNAWVSYSYTPGFDSDNSNTYLASIGWLYNIGTGPRFLRFD